MLHSNYHSAIYIFLLVAFISLCTISISIAGDQVIIKLATLAPTGSPWHENLKEMKMKWKTASNGQVELRIYPGGIAGDVRSLPNFGFSPITSMPLENKSDLRNSL